MSQPSQSNSPNSRSRRGGRSSSGRHRGHHRPQGSRSSHNRFDRERSDRAPREDHRDWEPVDRGRDIRRREAAKAPTLMGKILRVLTFGLLGKKAPAGKPVSKPSEKEQRSPRPNPAPRDSSSRGQRSSKEWTAAPVDPESVTGPKLHVGNLSYEAAESDLLELFKGAGHVESAEVVYHRDSHRSKGFAFVRMLTVEQARRAVEELHGKEFMGRRLEIGPARSTGERPVRDRA